ncbi:MAG: EAL domain-containing protein [Betaproteobacteria bacterium]|nr:EAL domain-containing protein [Betaproteobacteria bacterium]
MRLPSEPVPAWAQDGEGCAQRILQAAPAALLVVDRQGRILQANASAERLFGYETGALSGRGVEDLIPVRFRTGHAASLERYAAQGSRHRAMGDGAYQGLRRDGSEFPVEVGLGPLRMGDADLVVVNVGDLSAHRRVEEELRIAAISFESHAGMVVTDANGVIVRVNQAFTRLTGYSEAEAIGHTPALLRSGRHSTEFYQAMWSELKQTGFWQGEMWNRRKNGKVYAEWLTISAVSAPDGRITHYVGAFSDITHNKEAEAEIHRLAYYDSLTRLPNRRLLYDRLGQALASSARNGRHGALLFLDLDNFRTLNNTRGHDFGDQLLVLAAQRLNSAVREGDTVSRLGGDEFVAVLEDLSPLAMEATAQARLAGEKLREALAQPYELSNGEYFCTASLGITLFRGRGDTVESLLKQADLALYEAKDAGRNTLHFFDPAMQAALNERIALEGELRKALKRGQLSLHFQAQIDQQHRVIGAEVLLRWMHPQRGTIPPDLFIPLAEETGLILSIGHWVLARACTQIHVWAADPATRHLTLAVNVSARQFRQPEFVSEVRQVLADTGADAARLKIELTESLVIDNVNDTIAKMHELKTLGVGFAMDDFGTGFSSLSYLKRLPLDQLKIDRTFVNDISSNPHDAAIVQTIVSMGRILGMDVIAEGVETVQQRLFLERHGCHAYQGYLFSRPLPLLEFEQLLCRNAIAEEGNG